MKIFLSSTFVDLKEYRALVAEAIERLGDSAVRMEVFGARPEEPRAACLAEIESAELFLGIYAHRYGFIPVGEETSITEQEYRYAKRLGKPILCFLIDEEHPWPPKLIENDPGRAKLERLKAEVQSALVRDVFTTPEDLAFRVATSVARHLAQVMPPSRRPPDSIRLFVNCANLSEVLEVALAELTRITRTDYNQIFLVTSGPYSMQLVAVADAIPAHKQRYRIASYAGLLGEAATRGRTVRVDDVRARTGYVQAVVETRSELVVPISMNRAVVGLLNSEAEIERHYTSAAIAACEDLAESIAHALFRIDWRASDSLASLPWLKR